MNKVEIIKSFNLILSDFLKQVAPIIGTSYHHSFTQLIKINSVDPIKNFSYYVYNPERPLVQYIESRNETYFENTDNHKTHIDEVTNPENTLMEIIRLQNIYSQLNSESKENVWDILQALLQLCKEYNNIS